MFVQPESVWLIANMDTYITGDPQYEHSCKTNTDGNAGQHTQTLSSDLCTYRLTHTQTAKRGWWETPVAVRLHWCQHWANRGQLLTRQIYECYSSSVRVCVCVVLLGLPLAKASLLHLHFLRTPSLSLSPWKDWWAGWLFSILPDFLTEQREKRKNEESRTHRPSFIPLHLGSVKKTKILAVTNRVIKLYGPT